MSRVVRRARGGERIVITVDGVPAAEIGPLTGTGPETTVAELAAKGLVVPPRDTARPRPPPDPIALPPGVTSAAILHELRER